MATISLNTLREVLAVGLDRAVTNAAMFDQMGASLLASVRRGIQVEQGPDGRSWQQLKPATIQRRGSSHPILRLRGHLYQSITYHHDSEHAQVGTNVPYARIHQFGGKVQHKAGVGILHFRRTKNGQVRFTRATDKRARYGVKAAHGSYSAIVPARPYLFNNDGTAPESWKTPLVSIFLRSLKATFAEGGA